MTKLKFLFGIVLHVLIAIPASLYAQSYEELRIELMKRKGICVDMPETRVTVKSRLSSSSDDVCFVYFDNDGLLSDDIGKPAPSRRRLRTIGGHALYEVNIICRWDEHCTIMMKVDTEEAVPLVSSESRRPADSSSDICPNFFDHLLRENCGLPFLTNMYFAGDTLRLIEKKVAKLHRKYVREIIDPAVKRVSNADCGYVVTIPHTKRMNLSNAGDDFDVYADFNSLLHSRGTKCYGISLHRTDRRGTDDITLMLIMDRHSQGTVDDYVEQISHYIRFVPDFRLE